MKLPAGHMILYPATSLHHVRPVTRGARLASFFWIQEHGARRRERTLLFDLDTGDPNACSPACSLQAFITTCCAVGRTRDAFENGCSTLRTPGASGAPQ